MGVYVKKTNVLIVTMILAVGLVSCKDIFPGNGNVPIAEYEVTIENVSESYPILKSGAFAVPVGASDPGAIGPGGAYEFEFTAPQGARLSLTTMFVQSNDWIYSFGEAGIALYNEDGTKVTGDVTSQIDLYDVGTEEDQEPGTGSNQAPRQSGTDTGPADDNDNVRLVDDMDLPANNEVIKVTLSSTSEYGFRVRIENVSTSSTLQTSEGGKPVPLSPGAWLVHPASQSALLFTAGQPDYGEGLEAIAEDGMPGELAGNLADKTGLTVPLSPGAFAVYNGDNPIFDEGEPAPDNGLEEVAEDGMIDMLVSFLSSEGNVSESGGFNQPVGASGPGPLLPGDQYKFTFTATQGDRLTFATMYVQSNDLFYSPVEQGVSLFSKGNPISGDITDQVRLWDAGTEANEEPGVGGNQVLRQSGPDTGLEDSNTNVRLVNDQYDYGDTSDRIKVTIQRVMN